MRTKSIFYCYLNLETEGKINLLVTFRRHTIKPGTSEHGITNTEHWKTGGTTEH